MHIEERKSDSGSINWHISRPDRFNALGTSMGDELVKKLAELPEVPKLLHISAEPVTTKKGVYWIAGGDLKELAGLNHTQARAYAKTWSAICSQLELLPCPVLISIDGGVIGGAAEFALAADVRIGSERSFFDFRQLQIGLATGYGGAKRLVDAVGKAKAQRYLYLNQPIPAEAALEAGLLHEVTSVENLKRRSDEVMQQLISIHQQAFAAQKSMLLRASKGHKKSFNRAELNLFAKLWKNEAHKKILDRFSGK